MTLDREDYASWTISVGIHAALLLIMLIWMVRQQDLPIPREVEVLFGYDEPERRVPPPRPQPVTTDRSTDISRRIERSTAASASPRQAQRQPARPAATTAAPARGQSAPFIPPTQPRGHDQVEFLERGGEKTRVAPTAVTSVPVTPGTREQLPGSDAQRDRSGSAITKMPAEAGSPTVTGSPGSSTSISWSDGAARNRIAGTLPVFPPDVHREATITVRFRVRPDGSVFDITFVRKGEPKFENAVLTAMRTWKFNALPEGSRKEDQTGTAAFTFKLK